MSIKRLCELTSAADSLQLKPWLILPVVHFLELLKGKLLGRYLKHFICLMISQRMLMLRMSMRMTARLRISYHL
ncbi:hypothetical protein OIU77_000028 [Salix suchowensis]|uniref:Uncharacterized protein n=1 Tax=Salix suchowensis TaxID=1278906 RepID=A0ABQ9B4R2_9ROSI|nr:hypothetical protein OIU77_000028 [Salix suchowensis]